MNNYDQHAQQHRFNATIRATALCIKDSIAFDIKYPHPANWPRGVLARIEKNIKFIIENILTYPKDEQ